ncbi:Alcohol dehydrogenase GroES [uncultured virus]|nr:Alcohol dehydrogenase GroES [uncultured virus]
MDLPAPIPYNEVDWKSLSTESDLVALAYGTLHKDLPLELMIVQRRDLLPHDVAINIEYCGVCHSDWHVLKNEWKNTKYPIVVGHEIVGIVKQVGSSVKKFRVGDAVGLGPNYNSCRSCSQCQSHQEQYCASEVTETYNMPDRRVEELERPVVATGPITQGGFSSLIVADERYLLRVPKNAPMEKVAPLLCAGATMWTPLTEMRVGRGVRVGIAGYGGLGNIGAKLAKSMGAEVIILTTTQDKLQDAISRGADQALWVLDLELLDKYKETFDLIICTIPFRHDMDPYLELLKPTATMWVVGAMMPVDVDFDKLNRRGKIIRGSSTAGIASTQQCIDYCIANNIYPDVELISIQDLQGTREGIVTRQVRYRYVVDMATIYGA